jgi:hypothetical protein
MQILFRQCFKYTLRQSIHANGKGTLAQIELSRIFSLAKITLYYKAIIHITPLFKTLIIIYEPINFKKTNNTGVLNPIDQK